MRICLIPLKTEARSPSVNIKTLKDSLTQAMVQKPDLVCFPECTLTGYLCEYNDFAKYSEKIPGPATVMISSLAREHSAFICAGFIESTPIGTFNTAVLFDKDGEMVLKHRKVSEKPPFLNGASVDFADTELGCISILICADLFDKTAIGLIAPSVDIIIVPMSRGFDARSPDAERWNKEEKRAYVEAAQATGKKVIIVNALESGTDGPAFGGALIIGKQGRLLAESKHGTDEVLFWDMPGLLANPGLIRK